MLERQEFAARLHVIFGEIQRLRGEAETCRTMLPEGTGQLWTSAEGRQYQAAVSALDDQAQELGVLIQAFRHDRASALAAALEADVHAPTPLREYQLA